MFLGDCSGLLLGDLGLSAAGRMKKIIRVILR